MRPPSSSLVVGLGLALFAASLACVSTSPETCVPNASVTCACSGGGEGIQVCQANGVYSVCACVDGGAHPDGGDAGTPLPTEPQALADRTALGFGSEWGDGVFVGTAPTETLQIRNGGQAALTVSAASISGPNAASFAADQTFVGKSIASGQSAFVQVTLTAAEVGTPSATLQVTSNAQNAPTLTVALKANVVLLDGGIP